MNSKYLTTKLVQKIVDRNGEVIYDFTDTINEIKRDLDRLEQLEKENQELKEDNLQMQGYYDYYFKENQELKASYESLKKDYWELDKVENDILQKFLLQGQVISAIQDEIVKKIETETIYEDVSPLCEVTISINKKIFDMLFEKKEVLEDGEEEKA